MARNLLAVFGFGVAVLAVFLQKGECKKRSKVKSDFFLLVVHLWQ